MKITVKILKAKSEILWYANKIGQEFVVKKVEGKDRYEFKTGENSYRVIYAEDCEVI